MELRSVTSDLATHSLFQGREGGSIPTVTLIDHRSTKTMVETWHYSKRMPTGMNICFGWWIDDALYAVAVYGIGVNCYQARFLRSAGVEVGDKEIIELKRLARVEPRRDDMPLTKFLAVCHRSLKKTYRVVVSFSDPEHSHSGTVYRAANFKDFGETNPEWHLIDEAGNVRHRRFAFRYARRNGVTVEQARIELGVKRKKCLPKRRWVLVLR